jgi:glutathione S-transferase
MITLWGRLSSINVRKVVLTLQELGLPFHRIDAGGSHGVVGTAEFRARNPNQMIPLLQDGDLELWESNVIVRYLCARYAPDTLYPLPLPQRFDAERWMDWQQTTLNPASRGAFVQWFRTPADARDPQLIARSTADTEPLLDILDQQLAQRRFIAGDALTMADLPIACEVHRWRGLPQPQPEHPHLDRWYLAMRVRPSSQGVLDLPLS